MLLGFKHCMLFGALLVVCSFTRAGPLEEWLAPAANERSWLGEHRIELSARVQAGLMHNDNSSDNVFPTGFFNINEGFTLNRAELLAERSLHSSYKPRVGPFPGGTPDGWDWGFLIQGRYGEDFSRTYGFDDEWGINQDGRRVWILPQWFVKAYAPWGGGTTFQFGTWFTNIGNEIGAPVDPPSPFYSHSYAMLYGPSKHFGGLLSTRLPVDKKYGLWGVEVGIVQGWNNLQDNNSEKSLITGLQWRSSDMTLWVDFESIWGNEQSEDGIVDQRPFVAVSRHNESLFRQFHSLTVTQWFGESRHSRVVFNAVYGEQEGGDVVAGPGNPPGFLIVEDSQWYGWNISFLTALSENLQLGVRAEWLKDKDGAYFLLPEGRYSALTASVAWYPQPWLRIRPEIRYDRYSGPGKPFGGRLPTFLNGTEDEQMLFSVDATFFL